MCGIVGYLGSREATEVLIPALRRLEYRGYDSAGVASLNGCGLEVLRAVGKLSCLEQRLGEHPIHGHAGIGHTRWATHGRVSEQNAHPHVAGQVAVIHNGIVENFLELRAELEAAGRRFRSETDTEVIAHLIDANLETGMDLAEAVRAATRRLVGSFAIVALHARDHERLVVAKNATPIVIGLAEGEGFVASDVPALLDYTRDVIFLEDGEVAEITTNGVTITDFLGARRQREPRRITWDPVTARKGGYPHFLIKEIHEQPTAIRDTMRERLVPSTGKVGLPELEPLARRLQAVERVSLVACGTAWHAALVGRRFLSEIAGLRAEADYGSEFRYHRPVLDERDLLVAVSQSGETADTLGALEETRRLGVTTLAVSNVVDSSTARRADGVLYTRAGPEISVCSTKAFTTQLTALLLLAIDLGVRRGRADSRLLDAIVAGLAELPALVEKALATQAGVREVARRYARARDFLFLGRGLAYPIALEGALKLKEISYIHAEGYPAGEMKHGPIALVTDEMPVVILLPRDPLYAKTLSNLKEIESRGGKIIVVTDGATDELRRIAAEVIEVPRPAHELLAPFVLTIPLQLLAYFVAVERGTDVDQPRNLAKSVTVE